MPKLTVVAPESFADKAWCRPSGYGFAAQSNLIPVVAAELAPLVPAMPLGFIRMGESFQLVAIASLRPGTNLFVAPNGHWLGSYIPLALRVYPFQLVKIEDREDSALCFDSDCGLLVEAGQGEPFFDGTEPSEVIRGILTLLHEAEQSRALTQRRVDALQAAGLLQPWLMNLKEGEQTRPVEGLFRIDEAALNALADGDLLALGKAGAFGLAYAQLFSINQLPLLSKASEVQAGLRDKAQARERLKGLLPPGKEADFLIEGLGR